MKNLPTPLRRQSDKRFTISPKKNTILDTNQFIKKHFPDFPKHNWPKQVNGSATKAPRSGRPSQTKLHNTNNHQSQKQKPKNKHEANKFTISTQQTIADPYKFHDK